MTIENYIQAGLQHLGVYSESISDIIYFMALLVIIGIINWIIHVLTRQWLARIVLKLTKRTATNWDDLMLDQRFFNRLGLLIAPIVIQIVFKEFEWTQFTFLMKLINVWITLSFLLIVSSILDGINRIYDSYPMAKDRPIKVFIQVIKIFFYCAAIIIVISILIDKDPVALLAGLGAISAVLMLVFKDSILGFVAGIQLISNRMVNIGDWIVMPSSNADGDVIEIKESKKNTTRYKEIMEATAGNLIPEWLDVNSENLQGTVKELPKREAIDVPVDEMLIVELYSK